MSYPHIKMPDTSSPVNYILNPWSQQTSGVWYKTYYTCYQKECVPGIWNPTELAPPSAGLIEVSICKFMTEEGKRRILTSRYPEFRFHWDETKQRTVPPLQYKD